MARILSLKDAIFANSSATTIPSTPIPGVAYRNTAILESIIEEGWPYSEVVDSATFNEIMYRMASLLNEVEKQGILEWSLYTDYGIGAFARGSTDNKLYQALLASGPNEGVGVKDPDMGLNPIYWREIYFLTAAEKAAIEGLLPPDPGSETNYWGDSSDGALTLTTNTTWDSGSGGEMIVKNFTDFTINSGVTLTIYARKGCLIYVKGTFINNGTVNVHSRYSCDPVSSGVSASGIQIIRKKVGGTSSQATSIFSGCGSEAIASEANQAAITGDGTVYTIPRVPGTTSTSTGSSYGTGAGGGGGGNSWGNYVSYGGAPTCFSGGSGAGGSTYSQASNGSSTGGAGSNGAAGYWNEQGRYHSSGGGAGNPGGSGTNVYSSAGTYRNGGLLLIFVKENLQNNGAIFAVGGAGGSVSLSEGSGGGGSGGGCILAFYGTTYTNNGTFSAAGGAGGSAGHPGYAGGAGRLLVEKIDI